MDHFERNLLVEGRGKTPPGYRDSFLWRAEVTPGPVEVHLYDSAYCTYDGNRWNGIDHGEPGSNALDVEVGLPMWLRFETQYEIGDRLLAEHQAAHEAQMAREKKQREDASELLEMLFEFDDAEEWQMSDDGWANCEQGAEEGIYWCVRESFGSYWVRFENGWYVQKGEATDLPELRRVMKGMLAADKALDSELKVDE